MFEKLTTGMQVRGDVQVCTDQRATNVTLNAEYFLSGKAERAAFCQVSPAEASSATKQPGPLY